MKGLPCFDYAVRGARLGLVAGFGSTSLATPTFLRVVVLVGFLAAAALGVAVMLLYVWLTSEGTQSTSFRVVLLSSIAPTAAT